MELRDQVFPLFKRRDWLSCHRLLDQASPGKDREGRVSIAYWRAQVLEREGRYEEALRVLAAGRDDFHSKCLVAYLQATILNRIGQPDDAISTLRDAPIADEMDQFRALALEAAYLFCSLLAKKGREPPAELLGLIPDDFRTMDDDNRFVGKAELVDPSKRKPGIKGTPILQA